MILALDILGGQESVGDIYHLGLGIYNHLDDLIFKCMISTCMVLL